MGSAVMSQQMEMVCLWHGFCSTVHRGFCGALYSPPDLTPYILDKHNKKEKLKFYVRGWVITRRKKKKDSLIPLGVQPLINHQAMKVSSPNRGLKQTEQGTPQPHLSPSLTLFSLLLVGIFMRKEEM